jgi:septum formation protein
MGLQREGPGLVLASSSPTRAMLLRSAGLRFSVAPSAFDEAGIRERAWREGWDASQAAIALAEAKARTVSEQAPEALVIGADQILACDRAWFTKPLSRLEAAEQLRALRGRTHALATAVACATAGNVVWRFGTEAKVTLRNFSDLVLESVLDADPTVIGNSVGGYRLEGPGVLLCERIEGDHFTVLGLPLLPLLQFLREQTILMD